MRLACHACQLHLHASRMPIAPANADFELPMLFLILNSSLRLYNRKFNAYEYIPIVLTEHGFSYRGSKVPPQPESTTG